MLLINFILYYSVLCNRVSRRNVINVGLSNIIMSKSIGNNYASNVSNENKNFDYNYKYLIPEVDSDSETKTIIHTEDNNLYFQGSITP